MNFKKIRKIFNKKINIVLTTLGFSMLFASSIALVSLTTKPNTVNTESSLSSDNKLLARSNNQATQVPSKYTLFGPDKFFNDSVNGNFNYDQIYASQHFGNAWLGIDQNNEEHQDGLQYTLTDNNTSEDTITLGIKKLVISAINNLPSNNSDNHEIEYENSDNYLKINKYYVDNYSGKIVVNITLNIYNNESGLLVDCVKNVNNLPKTQDIVLDGFKKASATTISNISNIEKINNTPITSENIVEFAKPENFDALKEAYINQGGITNAIAIDSAFDQSQQNFKTKLYNPDNINVIAFPGIKQLRTKIGVTNFFKDSYVDTKTFKIYDAPSPTEYREKIGSFIFGENKNLIQEKSFVANYKIPNDKPTTFINEGTFDAPPSLRNKTASSITDYDLNQIKNTIDKDKLIHNPVYKFDFDNGTRQIITDWEIVTKPEEIKDQKLANDITGKLTLQVRLVDKYYYLGELQDSSKNTNLKGLNRLYTITIQQFYKSQPTSIIPDIDLSKINNEDISSKKASDFITDFINGNESKNKNNLIKFLKQATEQNNGFRGIPKKDNESDYDDFFNDTNLEFQLHTRIQDGIEYLGVPNDLEGTLQLTIKIKKYYSPLNGYLIDATKDEDKLTLSTKIKGFQTVDKEDNAYLKNNPNGFLIPLEYQKYIAKETIGSSNDYQDKTYSGTITTLQWKQIIKELVIGGNTKDFNLNENIQISTLDQAKSDDDAHQTDQYLSLNDNLSSNILGQLNLHFKIQNVLDSNDGIKITKLFDTSALFKNFYNIKATKLVNELTLNFINSNNIPFASDVIEQYNDDGSLDKEKQIDEFKKILLQQDGLGNLINIKYLFNDQKGIPKKINEDLIEKGVASYEELSKSFDTYFEIKSFETNENYYQIGNFNVTLGLKLYYNENGDLIDATKTNSNNPINYQTITIRGFKPSDITTNIPEVPLRNVNTKYASDYIEPSDLTSLILGQMQSDFDNQIQNRFFNNLPNNFFNSIVNTNGKLSSPLLSCRDVTIDNVNGKLSATIILKGSYFNENNKYIKNDSNGKPFLFTFSGFNSTYPTTINKQIKIENLIDPNDANSAKVVSNQLNDWSQKVDGVNPTSTLDLDFLKKVIRKNMLLFITNPYKEYLFNEENYFQITNPDLNYKEGKITFDLTLNYFYNNVDAYPISPGINYPGPYPSLNNSATITLIGFERKNATSVSPDPIDINNFDQNLAKFSSQAMTNQKDALKSSIVNNVSFLNNIFRNLPSTYNLNLSDNPEVTKEYIDDNLTIKIEPRGGDDGSINVYFNLKNIFIEDEKKPNTIIIGNKDLGPITIKGFKESSQTSFTSTNSNYWDLDPNVVANEKIAYWSEQDNKKETLENILNKKEIITKFTNNLVYNENGDIKSRIKIVEGSDMEIKAKDGTIKCSIYISPYYDKKGVEQDDANNKLENLTLRNFPQQNPTQQNNAVIYTSELVKDKKNDDVQDPIFGKKCNSSFLDELLDKNPTEQNKVKLLNEWLKDQLLTTAGNQLIINKMLFNVIADDISIPTEETKTTLEDIQLISSNDFNGSLNFKIKIKNFFNKDGNWTNGSTWLDNETFSIYQLNKVQKTNLTKIEANVTDVGLVYKNDYQHSTISFNPSLEASEFLNQIFRPNVIIEFQQFLQNKCVIEKGLFGTNAIFGLESHIPNNFKNLSLVIGDRVENPPFANEIKNFITADDSDGTISIKVTYQNVYEKAKETVITDSGDDKTSIKLISLDDTPTTKTMVIKINGFKKNNQTKDLIVLISIIIGSIGFILLLCVLIWFIIKKARSL